MNLNFNKGDFKKTLAPMWVSAIYFHESTATATPLAVPLIIRATGRSENPGG